MRRSLLAALAVSVCVFVFHGSVDAQSPGIASGETAMIDALYELNRLPLLRTGTTTELFSSYDRTGGNNDGFSGEYSKLRLEDGNSVLAEMEGPGCIQRIWFTHSDGNFGLLARKGEHVKIYLDGKTEPALDIPLEEVFSGKHEAFPNPLVGEGLGGFYCYVPIPYQDGCKVVVEGDNVRFYQITYQNFPKDQKVVSFTAKPTEAQKKSLYKAQLAWNNCGMLDLLGSSGTTEVSRHELNLKPGEIRKITLSGSKIIRSIRFLGTKEQLEKAGGSVITIHWDGASKPAVSAPLEYFFLAASQAVPLKTVLCGRTSEGFYNYMPMPFKTSAVVSLHTLQIPEGLQGTLEILTEPMPADYGPFGYFRTYFHSETPALPNEYFTFLKRNGTGHFLGVYMDTDGVHPRNIPNWMEGDDRWFTDGVFRGQGTGSEDYYNGGWYAIPGRLNDPGGFPAHGFPVYRYDESDGKSWCSAYRWHITDPVSYESSILAEMEHGEVNTYIANYRAIAFYYDVEP